MIPRRAFTAVSFLLLMLGTSFLYSLERSDVSFYLSFEKGLAPEISEGKPQIKLSVGSEKDVAFDAAGARGRAVKVNDKLSISYSGKIFSREEGTISYWMKPIGWKGADGFNHQFFEAYADNTPVTIYQFYPGNNWVYLHPKADPKTWRFVGGATWWVGWTDGRWEHVAFTFKPGEQTFYINGKLLERSTSNLVEPVFGKNNSFRLQPANKGLGQAFDEVAIFKRALSEQEVQCLARAPFKEPARLVIGPITEPTIDGKQTSSAEWGSASVITGWVDPLLGSANKDGVRIKVGHSEKSLHVMFTYSIPEKFRERRDVYVGSPLKVSVKNNDGDIFRDDYVGIFLSPPKSTDVYFFGINGAGAKRDEKNGNPQWNGTWSANQARDDYVWTAEFTISLSSLAPAAKKEGEWGINFLHGARQVDFFESIWFYQPRAQRPLAKATLAARKRAFAISSFGDLSDGSLSLAGSLDAGATGFEGESEVSISAAGKLLFGPKKKGLRVAPGKKEKFAASYELAEAACGNLKFAIKSKEGQTLFAYILPFVFSRQLTLDARYLPSPQTLQAIVDFGSTSMMKKATGTSIKIASAKTGEVLLTENLGAVKALQKTVTIDCKKLPVGKYDVIAEMKLGASTVTLKQPLLKEPPPVWLGNKLGYITKVPEPWVPLKLSDRTISCWGRDYTIGTCGLPGQVAILGKDVLAGPARILVTAFGKERPVPQGDFKVSESSQLKVVFNSSSSLGNLKIEGGGWMEFDGFLKNTLKVSAARATKIDALAIEIPIKPEYATLWSPSEYYPVLLGKSPKEKHTSKPRHGMRIGDEERGLQFTYVNASKQVLLPTEKEYVVRYELIDAPRRIGAKPLEFTFGLQALPVRPRSPIYRLFEVDDCTFTTAKKRQLFKISPLYTEGWSGHWNYLNFWNERAFDKTFIQKHKASYTSMWNTRKQSYCMYLNITSFDANTPEYRKYRFEWGGKDAAPAVPYDPATKTKPKTIGIQYETPSFLDFYMYYLNKTVRYLTDNGEFPIHCYLDNTASSRPFMKRLFTIMKSANRLNQVFVHMSGDNNMYGWSFSDWLIEGEENTSNYHSKLAGNPKLPKDYTQIIDIDKVASRYSPFAFGDKFFLYQFWNWNRTEPNEARPVRAHLWALLFVHDGTTWAAGGPAHKHALEELGWDDKVEFIPYWRKDTGIRVTSSSPSVVASGWKRGDGNLLVMVLNDSDGTAKCELSVDLPKFGFDASAVKCRDYGYGGLAYPDSFKQQTPKEFTVGKGKGLTFEIGRHSYKLVRFYR